MTVMNRSILNSLLNRWGGVSVDRVFALLWEASGLGNLTRHLGQRSEFSINNNKSRHPLGIAFSSHVNCLFTLWIKCLLLYISTAHPEFCLLEMPVQHWKPHHLIRNTIALKDIHPTSSRPLRPLQGLAELCLC